MEEMRKVGLKPNGASFGLAMEMESSEISSTELGSDFENVESSTMLQTSVFQSTTPLTEANMMIETAKLLREMVEMNVNPHVIVHALCMAGCVEKDELLCKEMLVKNCILNQHGDPIEERYKEYLDT